VRKKTFRIVVSTISLILATFLLLCCGVGYYVYAWLQVDPVAVAPNASEAERLTAVGRWLDDQFEKFKFNGGVLVVRDGEVLLSKTCGFTDHTATQRLNDHSAFRLASVSKQFTAAGALRLADMGLLDLDDPVAKHLEGFTIENVTIRHLLNQTSGIPDDYMSLAEQHRETLGEVLTISDVVNLVKQYSKLDHPPGSVMEYSNTNYLLLAGIVEAVSEVPFEQFMHENLFQPLGMNDTRVWNLRSSERSPNQANDFDQVDEERTPVETTWIDGVAGDGAVFCSLHDFVIWDQFWEGSPLVSDQLLREAVG
jgi:CubicO group peptidase (beta-lactamase class C family)